MPWVKHSDKLWSDPEFDKLSDGAQALWHRADYFIADHLLDGFIPERSLKMVRARSRYVQELVTKGWWERLEPGSELAGVRLESGGWLARGWQERIRSKAEVEKTRAETLQRVRKHRSGVTEPVSNPSPGPGPVPAPIPLSVQDREDQTGRQAEGVPVYEPKRPPTLPPPPPPSARPTAEVINLRPMPPEPTPDTLARLNAPTPRSAQERKLEMAVEAYREAFIDKWACDPGRLKLDDVAEFVRQAEVAAYEQLRQHGIRYEFKSVMRCAAYWFITLRKTRPAFSYLLENNRVADGLHLGADKNPPHWQPVVLSDTRKAAAE